MSVAFVMFHIPLRWSGRAAIDMLLRWSKEVSVGCWVEHSAVCGQDGLSRSVDFLSRVGLNTKDDSVLRF